VTAFFLQVFQGNVGYQIQETKDTSASGECNMSPFFFADKPLTEWAAHFKIFSLILKESE